MPVLRDGDGDPRTRDYYDAALLGKGLLTRGLQLMTGCDISHVYDLGCGQIDTMYYKLFPKDVKDVWLVDPNLKIYKSIEIERPTLHEVTDLESSDIPIGLPAVAWHPGFWGLTDDWYKENNLTKCEPWPETLKRLQPPVLAWSAYSRLEWVAEALILFGCGYKIIDQRCLKLFNEWKTIDPDGIVHGPGLCMGVAKYIGEKVGDLEEVTEFVRKEIHAFV